MIKKNNQTIDKIYKGTTEIAKIYKGSTLVYENYRDIIATGNDIINITKAKANSLNYLKAFGKCEQIGLPVGYQQVEYIESTGTQYIDTGINTNTTTSRYETKINPSLVSGTIGIFGTRDYSSATPSSMNVFIIDGIFRLDWLSGTISSSARISSNTEYAISITRGLATINNVNYTSGNTTSIDGSYTFCVGSFNNAGSVYPKGFSGKIYYSKLYNNNILVFDGVPCYRKSDNEIGMYDLVSNTFFTNAGTGTFTAGTEIVPTPSKPIPIWCNNGELKVSPNLFDKNNLNYIAGYLTVNGNKIESSSKTDTYYIECNPNTTYTLQREKVKTSGQVFRFASYSEVPTYNNQFTGMVGGLTDDLTLTITTGANDKYLAFSIGNVLHTDTEYIDKVQIEQGSTATQYRPYRQIYTDGTTETIKDSLNNTATAENLLSAGIYKDVQEVISGSVTRNVGIKVLDGTENWAYQSQYERFRLPILADNFISIGLRITPFVTTHFISVSDGRPISEVPNNACYSGILNITDDYSFYIKTTDFTSTKSWTQFLQQQYANGTPVIVVYPLATPTTETVTAQPMNIQKGTNIIEVTEASLDDLELEAKYKGK